MTKTPKPEEGEGIQIIATNRYARHEFFILETFEAGMELKGSEVKSLRQGGVTLKEGYAHVRNGEIYLEGVHVTPYEYAHHTNLLPVRSRRLLLNRSEIKKISDETSQKRLTIVPLKLYFKRGRAKIEIGLAKGKKLYDKRDSIKQREQTRIMDRAQRTRK